ncbi:MAG: hypothetical protein VKK05_00860 [Synechococcus sp.]|jgi:hypothetical protein|nr:hypothetical protein [Synechococcus sp.]
MQQIARSVADAIAAAGPAAYLLVDQRPLPPGVWCGLLPQRRLVAGTGMRIGGTNRF